MADFLTLRNSYLVTFTTWIFLYFSIQFSHTIACSFFHQINQITFKKDKCIILFNVCRPGMLLVKSSINIFPALFKPVLLFDLRLFLCGWIFCYTFEDINRSYMTGLELTVRWIRTSNHHHVIPFNPYTEQTFVVPAQVQIPDFEASGCVQPVSAVLPSCHLQVIHICFVRGVRDEGVWMRTRCFAVIQHGCRPTKEKEIYWK